MNEPKGPSMAKSLPGLGTPWPDRRVWSITRRLLALWRWEWEKGEDSTEAANTRASIHETLVDAKLEDL
jgi:hypothetical protein